MARFDRKSELNPKVQPPIGERLQPTAQAVGKKGVDEPAPEGAKEKAATQTPEARLNCFDVPQQRGI